MILPADDDRAIVVFHVWPSLPHQKRLMLSFGLIAVGLAIQLATVELFPGIVPIALGSLLLLVRGYNNLVDRGAFDPETEWEPVDSKRLADLRGLHRKIRQWDVSALDISNVLGAVVFVLTAGALGAIAWFTRGPTQILVIDAMILLLPHWLTGMRGVLVLPRLMVKVDTIHDLLARSERQLAGDRVQVLMQLKGRETQIPEDVKFKVELADRHEDLLGIYGQVVINEVQGRSYPYFYVVVVTRKGFGLRNVGARYPAPEGITIETELQDEVEVLVIRQTTTKKSGYHTDQEQAERIFDVGLSLAREHATKSALGA
ncbi:MAG: hypothetical protein GY723_03880 [bacterium]|nr:hypothetical protein [bacterium]